MEEQAQIHLAEELTRKDQQLNHLRQQHQYQQLQRTSLYSSSREKVLQSINHLQVCTGTGDVTVNSFFCSTEYLLSTIHEKSLRREAVKLIFYKTIQGQAKDIVINIPAPDDC